MHLVSVVNCDEGEIVGIQQLEYIGARGKHFPGNLNGLVDSNSRFPIPCVGPTLWDAQRSQQPQADHASEQFAVHSYTPSLRSPRCKVHTAAEFSSCHRKAF